MANPSLTNLLALMNTDTTLRAKDLELVQKIAEKTKEGKLYWDRSATGYSASIRDSMTLIFSRPTSAPSDSWYLFTVRTKEGDVLKIENKGGANQVMAILAGVAPADPVVQAVDQLFALVRKVGEGSVERAIRTLDAI